ncbi:MAG TPA: coproporphyrinogen III oxidase, partial [Spirochaetia bacterium]|nr:coproporphyrinogen III oxidase [Spirochaetia bacterium]
MPFCRSKCAYCDFHSGPLSAAPEGLAARIVEASLGRIDALAARFGSALGPGGGTAAVGSRFDTVYVGGGTPTVLPR